MTALPSWIDPEAFEAWRQMRLKKRVPWSDRCHKRALKRLQEIKDAGHDPNRALEESEFRGWTDIFPARDAAIEVSSAVQSQRQIQAFQDSITLSQSPEAIKAREACRAALKVVGK